jgi:hypothetical protein
VRRYDDPVDVRKGRVQGSTGSVEGPEQFLWHGRLWQVRDVVAHWVETGPWWQSAGVRAVIGSEDQPGVVGTVATLTSPDLLAEREVWRVEATPRGRAVAIPHDPDHPDDPDHRPGFGVFDLTFSWSTGGWRLTGCVD